MEKKINYIILIIVFLLIGFGIGKVSERGRWQEEIGKIQSQAQKEINWLKSLLEPFYSPLPEKVFSLSGIVKEKGENFLVMEVSIRVSQFPLPEGKEIEKQNIKANLADQTKIFKIEIIEPPPLPPEEPIKEKILSFDDIKVGDLIAVSSGENIKGKTEITASQIQFVR